MENRRLLSWQAILGDGGYSNVGASANDAAVAKDDTTTYLLTDEWGGVAHDANKSGTPDDDRLCWAAATSNTLAWTGWGNVSATGSSETDLFQYYKEHWENATGRPIHALNWWFDGVDRTLDWATWGHVFEPGGRFFPGVEFASYTNRVDYGDAGSADALPTVASYLGEGKAVMLYLHGPSSNHWLTCWGYDYRESDTDYYTGVWLTDSDDGQDGLVRYDVELDSDHWQIAQTADSYAGWPIGYVDVLSSRPSEIKEVPQSPANVSASTDLAAEILVSWDSAARADEYRLYRNTLDDFSTATAIATDLTSTSLSDAISLPGTTYHYWVIAANSGGESLPSLAATGIRPSAGINVSRVSGDTTEGGGTAAFTVTLTSQPSADVTIPLSSSDPTEGTVPASVTITPAQWQTGVVVTVTGVNDAADDGNTAYTIVTGDPASADASYDAFLADDVGDVAVTNADNDLSAHAGGPYSDDLGSQIALDASGSFNVGGSITSYAWDLDDDGQFDDADSVTAFFNATAKGRFTIRVQVTDDDGAAGVAAATVTVDNDTVGLYDPATGTFYLRNHNDAGNAEWTFNYGPGNLGWLPLAGDWNGDGIETVGLYNPATSTFYLKNTNSGGAADVTFRYGIAWLRWQPLVGDWNGDGVDTIGLYDPATGLFLLKNANSAGGADATFGYGPGGLGWQPLVGDWDGNGTDTVGVYDPAAAVFYLRNSNTSGVSDIGFAYGPPGSGWLPVVGNWDATGADTVGLYNAAAGTYFLRNANESGIADEVFGYGPAGLGWQTLIGDWDDTGGLLRAAAGDCPDFRGARRENRTVPLRRDAALTQADLAPIVAQAIVDWASAGVAVELLDSLDFVIADLPGSQLGCARSDTIFLDLDAAGHGWLIDPTPGEHEEFQTVNNRLEALDPAAIDRIDLLTVASHEIGHTLGLDDLDASLFNLMSGTLETGVRREPGFAEVDALFARL